MKIRKKNSKEKQIQQKLFGKCKRSIICHVIIVLDLRLTKVGARLCSYVLFPAANSFSRTNSESLPHFFIRYRYPNTSPPVSLSSSTESTTLSSFHESKRTCQSAKERKSLLKQLLRIIICRRYRRLLFRTSPLLLLLQVFLPQAMPMNPCPSFCKTAASPHFLFIIIQINTSSPPYDYALRPLLQIWFGHRMRLSIILSNLLFSKKMVSSPLSKDTLKEKF